jgi:hypothetical protein
MTPSVYVPLALREVIITRAQGRCGYCQSPARYSPEMFEIEHILPLPAGEQTALNNLALACPACNPYKGSRQTALDPLNNEDVALFNPRTASWADHFGWSADLQEIVGMAPSGRVAVVALRMNRPAVITFRLALSVAGLHPARAATKAGCA